jgi:hypothetical protein
MQVRQILLAMGLTAALSPAAPFFAQNATLKTPIAASAATTVPALVPYSGSAVASDGKALAGETGITFMIFKDDQGGEPLWAETQTVAVDALGHYQVHLGASTPSGLPSDLFSTGEARWLEIQIAGENPQDRILIASVPYAMKASDAATLGGLPASAFMLAGAASKNVSAAASPAIMPDTNSTVTTTGGTANYLAKFSGASTIVDSLIFDNGTDVGIGNTSPAATLDVHGTIFLRGDTSVYNIATATASAGSDSNDLIFLASAFDSSTSKAVKPLLEFQAEPTGNNTATPGATLNLLSSNGIAAAAETGFHFNANGTLNFAPGQTFPGTGAGTITGVTAGTALTGGGTAGNVTLNLDTTKVPELAVPNSFTGTQTVLSGDVALSSTKSAAIGAITIGGTPYLHGYSKGNDNVFVGNAGNFTTTSFDTAGTGWGALSNLTSGFANTATGSGALLDDTAGNENTAVGIDALSSASTGGSNTAIGAFANVTSGALTNTTEVGASATAGQSNTLILGNTDSTPGQDFVNVGIGTETPVSAMEMSVSANGAVGPVLTLTNPGGNSQSGPGEAAAAIDFNTVPVASSGYLPGARIEAVDDGSGLADFYFLTNSPFSPGSLQSDMKIFNNGEVFISSSEGASLTVLGAQFESFSVESLAANNNDGFYGAGGDADGSTTGGNGGDFYGGNATSGTGGYGLYASPGLSNGTTGKAALLDGNVQVNGTLSADLKEFKIDDPIDPANKYLVHSSIESSEMVNIYSGNVTTDELGLATVKLPDWFEAANGDFRYQLTVVGGQFAQAIVSKEIHDHEFTISTNATRVKVSWQVTGVRQDAYAKAHPMAAEEAKDEHERGFYIHPELYGQPEEKQIEWGRRPEAMQRLKAQRDKAKLALKTAASPIQRRQSVPPASAVNRKFATPAVARPRPVAQPEASVPAANAQTATVR